MTTTDPHGLTGAYALHALPDDERAAFERHLSGCESCAQEVAEFGATAARLALATAVPTRPAMREQVLRRVATVRQLPPAAASLDRVRRSMWRGRGVGRRALAACVAAAVACGGVAVWQYQRAQDAGDRAARAQRQVEELAGVLAAPDAKSRVARIGDGAATLVVSAGRDRAVFVASRMAAPPRGKVYELWFSDGGKMRAAGLMDPDRSDQAVLLRGKVDGASGIGITVEPEGGSRAPTTTPLALLGMPT